MLGGHAAAFALPVLCALTLSRAAAAVELGDADAFSELEAHGFVSQGFFLTLENNYLSPKSTRGSFEFSEAGINFTTRLSDQLQLGLQFFTQDLGDRGNYEPKLDWYYLDYRFQDWLGLRAGHLKIPYGLYNEIHDVDAARVPVLLPGSVYPLQSRQILFAHTGFELYGFARLGGFGALEYRAFGGTIFFDADELDPPGTPFDLVFDVRYVFGGRLLWETPLEGLRVGGSAQLLHFDTTVVVPGTLTLLIDNDSSLWALSAEYALSDLVLTAEYARWHADQNSDDPMLSPPLEQTDERAYAMLSYRLTPWLQPAVYYALFYPDVELREGRQNVQHDLSLTLRFDVNAHWIVKAEGHYMSGTAGLVDPLRINPPDVSLAESRWGAFFLKTTAHF